MTAGEAGEPDILDLVHAAVLVRDLKGRIVFINRACENLYGWPRDTALGRNAQDLLQSRHWQPQAEIEERLSAAGRWDGEISRTTASGAEIVVHAQWSVRRGPDGQATDIVESAQDITASRATGVELEQNRQRYRHLFHNMPMALLQLDATRLVALFKQTHALGVTDLKSHIDANPGFLPQALDALHIIEVNDLAVEMFGGRDPGDFTGPVARFWKTRPDTFRRAMEARYRGEPTFQEETRMDTLDGRQIDVLFAAARPGPASNMNVSLVGMIDISERMQAQAMLEQVQAEFAHAARISMLGELTASIAHEVNQPLAAIATNAEAGLRWLGRAEPNVEEARVLLKRTVGDARRAADIIARIRSMASLRTPEQVEISLHDVIEDALVFLRHEIQARGVTVTRALQATPATVVADRTQLQQVVVNLAVNAMQAMIQAGTDEKTIDIRTAMDGEGHVCCSIGDSGPGIDAGSAGRLFESFFTTKEGGMGMGLPISRSIIEAHGGRIWADNGPGAGGALISFTLPAAGQPS